MTTPAAILTNLPRRFANSFALLTILPVDLQSLCELGQTQLMRMEYLAAERTLAQAELAAWNARDWDSLARLYMPLQETRRQIRQRAGEGIFAMDWIASEASDALDPEQIVSETHEGQILVAGWQSIAPAARVREIVRERSLYLEVFLGAAFDSDFGTLVVVAPLAATPLPAGRARDPVVFRKHLSDDCLMLPLHHIPTGRHRGTLASHGWALDLWDRLHRFYFAKAEAETDPVRQIEAFRATIRVDSACELAHQKISQIATTLAKTA